MNRNILLIILLLSSTMHAQKTQWTFNADSEGWTLAHSLTGIVSGGLYNLTITGSDPYLFSPDNLNISTVTYGQFRLKLQNMTSDTGFQFF